MWCRIAGVDQPKRKNGEHGGSTVKTRFTEQLCFTEKWVRRVFTDIVSHAVLWLVKKNFFKSV